MILHPRNGSDAGVVDLRECKIIGVCCTGVSSGTNTEVDEYKTNPNPSVLSFPPSLNFTLRMAWSDDWITPRDQLKPLGPVQGLLPPLLLLSLYLARPSRTLNLTILPLYIYYSLYTSPFYTTGSTPDDYGRASLNFTLVLKQSTLSSFRNLPSNSPSRNARTIQFLNHGV